MGLFKYLSSFLLLFFSLAKIAQAHEAYVLPYDTFWKGLNGNFSMHAFDAMRDPGNIRLTLIIAVSVLILFLLNFLFRRSRVGRKIESIFVSRAHWGPHLVRAAIAGALFFSALDNSFLGPELRLSAFAYPELIRISLFAISIMVALGFLTELAAFVGIVIFIYGGVTFGPYIFTYLNYLGELIVLLLFGMRVLSLDRYIFGPLYRFHWFERYETVIVRVLYGLALVYAAITVKLLHPDLTLEVVNHWNLTQFHWLFPSDPLLVTFGAGVVEALIGLLIIFGFEMRLTVLISLFYITLSLLYFRELVWPHLLLYGISLNLLIQPETFTIDHLLFAKHRREKSWWKRPSASHNEKGKSDISVSGRY